MPEPPLPPSLSNDSALPVRPPLVPPLTGVEDVCSGLVVPSSRDFFAGLEGVSLWLLGGGIVAALASLCLFALHLYTIARHIHSPRRQLLYGQLAAVFPVTAVGCLVGACLPRGLPVSDAAVQAYFGLVGLFALTSLSLDFFGGHLGAAKALRGRQLELALPPLCCFLGPLLPSPRVHRGNLWRLCSLICQAGVVRPLVLVAKGLMWADGHSELDPASTPILLLLTLVSTMGAMWGLQILRRLLASAVPEFRPGELIGLSQAVLLLQGFQTGAFALLASPLLGPLIACDGLLPGASRAALWARVLLAAEMAVLSALATLLLRPTRNAAFDLHPCWNLPEDRKSSVKRSITTAH